MNIIKSLTLKNFRSFRTSESIDLSQATYIIGVNNAGKTNVFHGLRAFFDDHYYSDDSFLNKTEFAAKKAGYNRAEITISFDLNALTTKIRKLRLIKKYGAELKITKLLTYTPISGSVFTTWLVEGKIEEILHDDIKWLIKTVEVTSIHPQEGKLLLSNVQKKLRQRLLANWGRNATLTHSIMELEEKWGKMRTSANDYLSRSISESLQAFWPDSKVTIDLPRNIKEIIDVSEINFQGYSGAPSIGLTSQGTGAQSTVLYLAHFLLDSDRSLHRGEYHPLWILEEPESFLHMGLLLKLATEINSDLWMNNIQMVISTHSPALLASSRRGGEKVTWNILSSDHKPAISVTEAKESDILAVGDLMGDVNFFAYFTIAQSNRLIFIEDEKEEVVEAYKQAGIDVTRGLKGATDVARYLDLLKANPEILRSAAYFIVDGDQGLEHLDRHTQATTEIQHEAGFKKLKLKEIANVFLITLPSDKAIEDLFDQYDGYLRNCVSKIWKADFTIKTNTPSSLAGTVTKARRTNIINETEAISYLRKCQEVKDQFWEAVRKHSYALNAKNVAIIKKFVA